MTVVTTENFDTSKFELSKMQPNKTKSKDMIYVNFKDDGKSGPLFYQIDGKLPFGLTNFDKSRPKDAPIVITESTNEYLPINISDEDKVNLKAIEGIVIDRLAKDSERIHGKKKSREDIEDDFNSPVKEAKKEGFNGFINLKMYKNNGYYDNPERGIVFTDEDDNVLRATPENHLKVFPKGASVTALIRCAGVYILGAGTKKVSYGISWVPAKLQISTKSGYGFQIPELVKKTKQVKINVQEKVNEDMDQEVVNKQQESEEVEQQSERDNQEQSESENEQEEQRVEESQSESDDDLLDDLDNIVETTKKAAVKKAPVKKTTKK